MFESFPIKSPNLVITAESVRKVSGRFTLHIRGEDSTSIDGNTCVILTDVDCWMLLSLFSDCICHSSTE